MTERGFALLIVLWTIVLLAVLVAHLTASGRGETQLARNLRTAAVLQSAADGAISEGIFHVMDTSNAHWPANGAIRQTEMPGALVTLRITSEAGKLNINTVQPALLLALLHVTGADTGSAASVAAAVADWRFPDANILPGGAKASQYRDAGRDYGPPGAPFQSMEELGLVLGMTPSIRARIGPYISLYHDGDPDTRVAGAPVLQAIREATGAVPVPTTGPPDERVVVITATATAPDSQFVRRAVIKMGSRAKDGLFQILTWDTAQN